MISIGRRHAAFQTIEEAVSYANEIGECSVPRRLLRTVFPHDDRALVASRGILSKDSCMLVLDRRNFGPYIKGHLWLFPQHWLGEMAALVAGLEARRAVLGKKSAEECAAFNLPVTIKGGDWERQPPAVDPRLNIPITARVSDFNIHIGGGSIRYEANVLIEHGDRQAVYNGIVVLIRKGGKQESSGE